MGNFRIDCSRIRHDRFHVALVEVIANSGFHAVALYRLSQWMCKRRIPILPEVIRAISVCLTGAEICPQAQIGPGFVIRHPAGIVIGHGVVMGSGCTLLQNVTIGERLDDPDDHSYPVIGNNVIVCAGAVIVGNITIGTDATVGANAVVLSDIPAGATAVGVPAKVVSIKQHLQA